MLLRHMDMTSGPFEWSRQTRPLSVKVNCISWTVLTLDVWLGFGVPNYKRFKVLLEYLNLEEIKSRIEKKT